MTDKVVKAKMEQFIALGNELQDEARKRYGRGGSLFTEAEGGVFLMSGDCGGSVAERQEFIKVRADQNARWGSGAW